MDSKKILEVIPWCVFITDKEGNVEFKNKRAENFFFIDSVKTTNIFKNIEECCKIDTETFSELKNKIQEFIKYDLQKTVYFLSLYDPKNEVFNCYEIQFINNNENIIITINDNNDILNKFHLGHRIAENDSKELYKMIDNITHELDELITDLSYEKNLLTEEKKISIIKLMNEKISKTMSFLSL